MRFLAALLGLVGVAASSSSRDAILQKIRREVKVLTEMRRAQSVNPSPIEQDVVVQVEPEVKEVSPFDRTQQALKRQYRLRKPVLLAMERRGNTVESLKDFASFIQTHMVMSPDNAILVYKTFNKLVKAEKDAQKKADKHNKENAEKALNARTSPMSPLVSEDVRNEVKTTLLDVYKESTFRPLSSPSIIGAQLEAARRHLKKVNTGKAHEEPRQLNELEDIKVAEQRKKLERAYVRPEMKRFMGGNNAEVGKIEDLISLIRSRMVLSTENADVFAKTVDRLRKAQEVARKAADKRAIKAVGRIGLKFATVPYEVREDIKATLVKIYNESTFRPLAATPNLRNETLAGLAPWDLEAEYRARNAQEMYEWEVEQFRLGNTRLSSRFGFNGGLPGMQDWEPEQLELIASRLIAEAALRRRRF